MGKVKLAHIDESDVKYSEATSTMMTTISNSLTDSIRYGYKRIERLEKLVRRRAWLGAKKKHR